MSTTHACTTHAMASCSVQPYLHDYSDLIVFKKHAKKVHELWGLAVLQDLNFIDDASLLCSVESGPTAA